MKILNKTFRRKIRRVAIAFLFLGGIWFYFCLPDTLFEDPVSHTLQNENSQLFGAKISSDGQWRFPPISEVPKDWENCIIHYEDQRFRSHVGVDPKAILRAIRSNTSNGRIVSGASTISMQLIRMSRKGKPRTYFQKIVESLMALRLEMRYSKDEILAMYASNAPFGGNVVGLSAASWRYFGKPVENLSLSESATLAVLPNAPGLIHPGRNRNALKIKRNGLLQDMYNRQIIDSLDYVLALDEPLPQKPISLPQIAPHYLEWTREKSTFDTLHMDYQQMLNQVANSHHGINKADDIQNLAILLLDTRSGDILGYVGNAPNSRHEKNVDMIQASRSSGSVLKPILHLHMLHEGKILPQTLLKDIPTQIQGYRPRNYHKDYDGAVSASVALSRSLNIPAIHSLQEYGIERFINRLREHQLTTIDKSAEHYGLSLILGGAEVNLYELTKAYAKMGATLLNTQSENCIEGSVYLTFDAMRKLNRPDSEGHWEEFNSSREIAWKTGTSYGHRDAWAVGVTPEFTIGIWVGNADGEGRHGLVGVKKAAPILFDVLNQLPQTTWFDLPANCLDLSITCSKSGHIATDHCSSTDTTLVPRNYQNTSPCPYHQTIKLNANGFVANSMCTPVHKMESRSYFILPPNQAHYYQQRDASYKSMPIRDPYCSENGSRQTEPLAFLYPEDQSEIYLPTDLNGKEEKAIFKATHAHPKGILHWHLDDKYLGKTESGFHSMHVSSSKGSHTMLIVDQWGNEMKRDFEIVN